MPARATSFARRLVTWQKTHGRHDLPWQRTRDPYRDLALRDHAAANAGVHRRSVLRALSRGVSDVRALADAPLDRVLELWSGLGYYRRAHHLHAAAVAIVARHGGRVSARCRHHRDAARHRPLDGGGDRSVRVRRARGNPRRQREARARAPSRRRGLPGAPKVEAKLWSLAQSLLPQEDIERIRRR